MSYITLLLISFGLAMDCFAVSITSGVCMPCITRKKALQIAIFFGFFQGFMPVLGWLLGLTFKSFISEIDHWIAFGILLIIGGKMLIEAIRAKAGEKCFNLNNMMVLLSLSVATSIDALIIGMSFAFLEISIIQAVISIGVITFFMSLFGILLGKKFGHFTGNKAEIIGGLILIVIGTKILIEHTLLK